MNNRDYVRALVREIEARGVRQWSVTRGRHMRLEFVWNDRPMSIVFPTSPSDRRGQQKAVSYLRRALRG